jgi:hypothetical protein
MKYILTLIIGILLGSIVTFLFIKKDVETVTVTNTEIVYDTIPKIIKVPVIHTVTKVETEFEFVEVEIPANIDTTAVIIDYFTKYVSYRKWEDENLRVSIRDSIYKNSLESGDLEYTILRPTTINTTTVVQNLGKKRSITLEAVVPVSEMNNFGLRSTYIFDNRLLSLTYRPQNKTFELGFGVKIISW